MQQVLYNAQCTIMSSTENTEELVDIGEKLCTIKTRLWLDA
jgi:hypothetical protein